jgi:hypothetical protein
MGYTYDYGSDSASGGGLGINASDYTGGSSALSTGVQSGASAGGGWYGAAITAAAGLVGGYFQNKANNSAKNEERELAREKMIMELELEKLRILNAKGGGGGRSRDLELLEMALGIYGDSSSGTSKTLNSAADRYASIYNSAGAGGR